MFESKIFECLNSKFAPFFDEHLIRHSIVLFSGFILFKFDHFFQIFILFRRNSMRLKRYNQRVELVLHISGCWIEGFYFAKRSFFLLFWIGVFDLAFSCFELLSPRSRNIRATAKETKIIRSRIIIGSRIVSLYQN